MDNVVQLGDYKLTPEKLLLKKIEAFRYDQELMDIYFDDEYGPCWRCEGMGV